MRQPNTRIDAIPVPLPDLESLVLARFLRSVEPKDITKWTRPDCSYEHGTRPEADVLRSAFNILSATLVLYGHGDFSTITVNEVSGCRKPKK